MTTPTPAGSKFAGLILPGVSLALLISAATNLHLANELREAHAIARDALAAQLGAQAASVPAVPAQIEEPAPLELPSTAPAEPAEQRRSACTWPECDVPPADASPIPAQG